MAAFFYLDVALTFGYSVRCKCVLVGVDNLLNIFFGFVTIVLENILGNHF